MLLVIRLSVYGGRFEEFFACGNLLLVAIQVHVQISGKLVQDLV